MKRITSIIVFLLFAALVFAGCDEDSGPAAGCTENQHTYDGMCEDNTIEHCASHDYVCKDNVTGWGDGICKNGICAATACLSGYVLQGQTCIQL